MSTKERIEAVLQQYKGAVLSYGWENHYRDNKPLEQGFDRQMMASTTSSLYDDVCSLFVELSISQAMRYVAAWERRYIIDVWCADDDRADYDGLQAIGQTFINECKRIAQEVCKPEGEQPQGGRGTYHPKQVQQKKAQTEKEVLHLSDDVKALLERATRKGVIEADGCKYRWKDTASLYGYFVDKTSDFLNLRHSNNRIPWKKYEAFITNHRELLATARQAVNDYKNKKLNPPEGDDIVNELINI